MTGYSEEGDLVVLRMTRTDYDALLIMIGYAAGKAESELMSKAAIRVANRINEGNPYWKPYQIKEEE